jgi:hypothetical protein
MTVATNTIQTTDLTSEVITQNLCVLIEALESQEYQRATQVLISKRSGGTAYCCLGVASLLAGLSINDDGFLSQDDQRFTCLPPPEVSAAIGAYDLDTSVIKAGDVGPVPEGISRDDDIPVIDVLMSLNDGAESGEHWEDGYVLNQLRLLRDYWMADSERG